MTPSNRPFVFTILLRLCMVYDITTCLIPARVCCEERIQNTGSVLLALPIHSILTSPCCHSYAASDHFIWSFYFLLSHSFLTLYCSNRPLFKFVFGACELEAVQVFAKQTQSQAASCLSCSQVHFAIQAIAHRFSSTLAVFQHHVFIFRPFQGPSSTCFPNGRPARPFLKLQIDA